MLDLTKIKVNLSRFHFKITDFWTKNVFYSVLCNLNYFLRFRFRLFNKLRFRFCQTKNYGSSGSGSVSGSTTLVLLRKSENSEWDPPLPKQNADSPLHPGLEIVHAGLDILPKVVIWDESEHLPPPLLAP